MDTRNIKRKILFLLILFLAAFLPRLICLYQLNKSFISNMLVLDSGDYDRWAMEIAKGDWIGKNVFHAMPFYPYFLGVVYFLFGHFLSVVRFIQITIGSINCLLVYWLAKRVFGKTVDIVAFLGCVFFGLFIFYDNMIIATPWITFSYLLALNLIFSFSQRPTIGLAFLIGLAWGVSCLMAASGLMFIAVFIFWLFFWLFKTNRKKAFWHSLIFLVAVVLIILPVTIRNYFVSKDFVLITAHGGLNFYLGNNPRADGANIDLPFFSSGSKDMIEDSIGFAERTLKRRLKPSEASSFWFHKAIEFISANPAQFFGLLFIKLRLFLIGYDIPDVFLAAFYANYATVLKVFEWSPSRLNLIIPLGILGLVASWRERKRNKFLYLIYLFLFSYIFSVVLFLVNTRYKMPILPLFIIFGSYLIIDLFEKIRKGEFPQVIIYFVSFIILYPLLNNGQLYYIYRPNESASHAFLGNYLLEKRQFDNAVEEFKKAVKLEPRRAEAHNMLGLSYLAKGDLDNAEREFVTAIELKPYLLMPYNNMAQVYLKRGNKKEALGFFEKSLAVNPNQPGLQAIIDRLKLEK